MLHLLHCCPCIRWDRMQVHVPGDLRRRVSEHNLTPDQLRSYIIADNRLAERAGWDKSILAIELQNLLMLDDLDVTITGFDVPEIDLILEEANAQPADKEDPCC